MPNPIFSSARFCSRRAVSRARFSRPDSAQHGRTHVSICQGFVAFIECLSQSVVSEPRMTATSTSSVTVAVDREAITGFSARPPPGSFQQRDMSSMNGAIFEKSSQVCFKLTSCLVTVSRVCRAGFHNNRIEVGPGFPVATSAAEESECAGICRSEVGANQRQVGVR